MYSYTVSCLFEDRLVAQNWLQWLRDEHIREVIDNGAKSAEIFEMDDAIRFEVRYQFSSKLEFEAYARDRAPRLREKALAKFPLDLGIKYSRTTGGSIFRING